MVEIKIPKSFQQLLAIVGFGCVLAGSGIQGLIPNMFTVEAGIFMIYLDIFLWVLLNWRIINPKRSHRRKNKSVVNK